MQLLNFKIPGLHGNLIDEFHGFKYSEDDYETFEYPPVVLTLGTGGMMDAGYLVNQDWKSLNLLKEITPIISCEEEEKKSIEDPNLALREPTK